MTCVEIERIATIRDDLDNYPWLQHISGSNDKFNRDVAKAAAELGYKVGEKVPYKIIIEPKK